MNKKLQLSLVLFCTSLFGFSQTTYYVDQANGANSNSGTSLGQAYKTFNKALTGANRGDTIKIVGQYHNASYDSNLSVTKLSTIKTNNPGDPGRIAALKANAIEPKLWHKENTIEIKNWNKTGSGYLTIEGYDSNAKLLGDGANILLINKSSFLRIQNIEIEGEVSRIDLSEANALQFVYTLKSNTSNLSVGDIHIRDYEDQLDGNAPQIDGTPNEFTDVNQNSFSRPSWIDTRGLYIKSQGSTLSHDIILNNVTIHHTPGGGLRVADGYNVTIEGCDVYRCSARSNSGTHGLVLTKTRKNPNGNAGDYSIKVIGNKVHHNYNEQFSWVKTKIIITPHIDEGKGISLQRNNLAAWNNGNQRILVANNLCYWNGFSGVHSNDGQHIDFVNNTCFMNSYTNTEGGEANKGRNIGISTSDIGDYKFINNISVTDDGWNGFALSCKTGDLLSANVRNNLIYGSSGVEGNLATDNDVPSGNSNKQVYGNPLFANAPIAFHDENYAFDFALQAGSPAKDTGNSTDSAVQTTDFNNVTWKNGVDRGAIESDQTVLSVIDLDDSKIGVYPNPFNNSITITGAEKIENIALFSITGQQVILENKLNNNTLDLSHLTSGVYIIKVNNTSKKLIKK